MSLVKPADIKAKVARLWESQRLLRAWLSDEPLFPLEVPLSPPSGAALAERFGEVRAWIGALKAETKNVRGHGYELIEETVMHRQLGIQRLPARAVVPTLEDGVRLAGKWQAFQRFVALARETRQRFPDLEPLMRAKPLTMLEHEADWSRLLDVCAHFVAWPRPGCHLRAVDVPGVDTKFIERHERLLWDLLAATLPLEYQNDKVGRNESHAFERRFGLCFERPLVRFRCLDPSLEVGFSDMTVPLDEFGAWPASGVETVFVTENKVNGLAFPSVPKAIVIFGLGYGVEALREVAWLARRRLIYWGDLDTHGFAMLAKLRGHWAHTESMLMDDVTLLTHRWAWGQEPEKQRWIGELSHLVASEQVVFDGLRQDCWGVRVRLEQERISFRALEQVVANLRC